MQLIPKAFIKIILLVLLNTFCFTALAKEERDETNFFVLSDIHFDPFISCQKNNRPCPLIQELIKAPVTSWKQIFLRYDSKDPEYRQDTNYGLLKSTLRKGKELVSQEHPQFVLVLGDLLGHDFREYYSSFSKDATSTGYEQFVRKLNQFLARELNEAFPLIDIYQVIGNNDSYQGDYYQIPRGKFFNDLKTTWLGLIRNKENRKNLASTFRQGGYYHVIIPRQSLRIILLNSVLFSANARGPSIDQAAMAELKWLELELKAAQTHHQKVLIAMHIPPGIDVYATLRIRLFRLVELWKTKYSQIFQSLLQKYASEISGVLAGHLHSDWFQILTFGPNKLEVPITGVPAVSPIFGNNPGFKRYTYSAKNFQLIDFVTFYYPIKTKRIWETEYNFSKVYLPNCCNVISQRGYI